MLTQSPLNDLLGHETDALKLSAKDGKHMGLLTILASQRAETKCYRSGSHRKKGLVFPTEHRKGKGIRATLRAVGRNIKIPVNLLQLVTGPVRCLALLCKASDLITPSSATPLWGDEPGDYALRESGSVEVGGKIPTLKTGGLSERYTHFTLGSLFPLSSPIT